MSSLFSFSVKSIQKYVKQKKKVERGKKEIKIDVTRSGAVLLKPVKPQLFLLFANAELTELELLGRERLNYLRLKKIPDHSMSYFV